MEAVGHYKQSPVLQECPIFSARDLNVMEDSYFFSWSCVLYLIWHSTPRLTVKNLSAEVETLWEKCSFWRTAADLSCDCVDCKTISLENVQMHLQIWKKVNIQAIMALNLQWTVFFFLKKKKNPLDTSFEVCLHMIHSMRHVAWNGSANMLISKRFNGYRVHILICSVHSSSFH